MLVKSLGACNYDGGVALLPETSIVGAVDVPRHKDQRTNMRPGRNLGSLHIYARDAIRKSLNYASKYALSHSFDRSIAIQWRQTRVLPRASTIRDCEFRITSLEENS